jgi:carboxymethylenebutenolidase
MRMGGDIAFETPAGSIGAWRADPVSAPRGGILVVQEIFGVNAHIRAVADRYAAEGYVALAPAFFDAVERDVELGYDKDGMARGRDLAQAVGLERASAIAGAAARLLRDEGLKVGIVGFCWGGTVALLGNTRHGLPASSYYGARDVPFLDEPLRAPIQFHFGADDPSIPPEAVEAHRAKQPDAEVYVYEGAGHAFNRDIDGTHYHADAARLAHQRTMRLFAETLG